MNKQAFLFCGCVVLFCCNVINGRVQDGSAREASALWERVISAKGGRERLRPLDDVLETVPRPKLSQRPSSVQLYVFPDKLWFWNDQARPLGNSLHVTTENGFWMAHASERGRESTTTWFPEIPRFEENALFEPHVRYLLETRWLQPKPLSLRNDRIGREDFDVITVDFGIRANKPYRVDYYVDRKTLMVRGFRTGKGSVIELSGYTSVDGIMMPSGIKWDSKAKPAPLEFKFNVDYDPSIFVRKPALEDGPDGWKRLK